MSTHIYHLPDDDLGFEEHPEEGGGRRAASGAGGRWVSGSKTWQTRARDTAGVGTTPCGKHPGGTEYGTMCLCYYFGSWTILAVRIGVSSVASYRLLIPADDGERHPSIQRWKHANRAVFFSTFTVLPTVEAQ